MLPFRQLAQLSHVAEDKPHFPLREKLELHIVHRIDDTPYAQR